MFVPATRVERAAKARASGADGVILDLEDAVPAEEKPAARRRLTEDPDRSRDAFVRINAVDTEWFDDDVAVVRDLPIRGVMLPKAQAPDDVERLLERLGRPLPILVLVETVAGIADLTALLRSPGVAGAAFGSLDYALDLGAEADWEALLAARSELVFRCRLAGLPPPLDGVTTSIDDEAVVRDDARRARALGFGGKLLVHPRQVAPVVSVFRPDAETIARARRVLAASLGGGAARLDGRMIDRPVIEAAKATLRRAGMIDGAASSAAAGDSDPGSVVV